MSLEAQVRRVDEDRWLASRFASAAARARLIALYAVNYEIARTSEIVRTAPLGDVRLAWWRDALDEIHAGQPPRNHPALKAYAAEHACAPFLTQPWANMLEARTADFDPAPFATLEALVGYLDGAAGALMRLAIAAVDPSVSADAFVQPAARAWGLTGLLRAAPVWSARGRTLLPPGVSSAAVAALATSAHAEARALASTLPAHLFGAFGYVALAPRYLRDVSRPPSLLERQARLIAASATGRV
jgi:15-cis-phytoene synthase